MSIAENVRKYRRLANLSQRELADVSGVSQQLISQIERGENNSTKYLAHLARALNRTLTDFDQSLTDVVPDEDGFASRYSKLSEEDQLVVQALIERLERTSGP